MISTNHFNVTFVTSTWRGSVNGRVPTTSVKQAKFDLKYRKVIQYVDYSQDQNDVFSGHGSHVSGTLVGTF